MRKNEIIRLSGRFSNDTHKKGAKSPFKLSFSQIRHLKILITTAKHRQNAQFGATPLYTEQDNKSGYIRFSLPQPLNRRAAQPPSQVPLLQQQSLHLLQIYLCVPARESEYLLLWRPTCHHVYHRP